jgi:hypothetical protein
MAYQLLLLLGDDLICIVMSMELLQFYYSKICVIGIAGFAIVAFLGQTMVSLLWGATAQGPVNRPDRPRWLGETEDARQANSRIFQFSILVSA